MRREGIGIDAELGHHEWDSLRHEPGGDSDVWGAVAVTFGSKTVGRFLGLALMIAGIAAYSLAAAQEGGDGAAGAGVDVDPAAISLPDGAADSAAEAGENGVEDEEEVRRPSAAAGQQSGQGPVSFDDLTVGSPHSQQLGVFGGR